MAVNEQGHAGKYSGNSRHSYNHAHTRVTAGNYEATKRDDEAHMDYLKRDVLYDDHHGHSDEKMTADEKHISRLAGDLKYDEKHHGPGDFRGGYHKVLHAEGKAHQGPAKSRDNSKRHPATKAPKAKNEQTKDPRPKQEQLDAYLKKKQEQQLQDLLNKYDKPPKNQPPKKKTKKES